MPLQMNDVMWEYVIVAIFLMIILYSIGFLTVILCELTLNFLGI